MSESTENREDQHTSDVAGAEAGNDDDPSHSGSDRPAEETTLADDDVETSQATEIPGDYEAAQYQVELEKNEAELARIRDLHLRLTAEFANYRRRTEKERSVTWTRAQGDLVGHLLDAVDDLERVGGLDAEGTSTAAVLEGIELVADKFSKALAGSGVEVLDPVRGTPFDPNVMEAMMLVPTESEEEDDQVDAVFQKGYVIGDDLLIRPVRVSVLKHG